MSGFDGQEQLPLFPYDCTAQQAQETQAESAKIVDAIELQELKGRLDSIGLNRAAGIAHRQYNYQRESTVATLHCSNAAMVLPASFSSQIQNHIKHSFLKSGVSGLGQLIDTMSTTEKEKFFRDIQTYRLIAGSFSGQGKDKIESKKPLYMFSVLTAIYHRITVGDSLRGVTIEREKIGTSVDADQLIHMAFGELYQNGEPLRGFGDFLRKSTFGQITMQIFEGKLDFNMSPRAYNLKINNDGAQTITNDIFGQYERTITILKDGCFNEFISFSLNRDFFPIRKGESNVPVSDGSYSIFLAGLYPLLHCCAKWNHDNKRDFYITKTKDGREKKNYLPKADNQFSFFLAMQFSDKNAAQLGITNGDFDALFHNSFYRTVNTQHFIRLGEIPLAELLGCECFFNQDGKKRCQWGELTRKINMITRNFYAFLNATGLLRIYQEKLKNISTRLYLPVDALAIQGAVKIRTAGFSEWCYLMNETERKANES